MIAGALRLILPAQDQTDGESGPVTEEVAESAASLVDSFVEQLPRLGIAAAIILIGYLLIKLAKRQLFRYLSQDRSDSYATVISKITAWILMILVVLVALTVTFPSVKPVDLLAGLGFFSVAIGFAFQDILENTLSGVLLLFRQPFNIGDQIEVSGTEGTAEAITIRETRIRRYDGQLVVVPNRDVYKNAIRVQTSKPDRRIHFTVGVDYDTDLDFATDKIMEALAPIDRIADDPAPIVIVDEFAASAITLTTMAWVESSQADALQARDSMMRAVKRALDDADILIPFDTVTVQGSESLARAMGQGPIESV